MDSLSTNTIDQLLGHTDGPAEPITGRDLTRARSSAYIVHGNFNELTQMCDNIQTGTVVAEKDVDKTDVENEVYRRVHNYLSSLFSYNEQIRDILNKRLSQHIGKRYFLPSRDNKAAPEYVKQGVFLWGLRNDFQHGDYWCLELKLEETRGEKTYYQLYFIKQDFEATPKGGLDEAGDYLCHKDDAELQYPIPYIADFHRNQFSEFENDFESWCVRKRD